MRTQQSPKAEKDRFKNPPNDEDRRCAYPYDDHNNYYDEADYKPEGPPTGVKMFRAAMPDRPINLATRFPFGSHRTRYYGDTVDFNNLYLNSFFFGNSHGQT